MLVTQIKLSVFVNLTWNTSHITYHFFCQGNPIAILKTVLSGNTFGRILWETVLMDRGEISPKILSEFERDS